MGWLRVPVRGVHDKMEAGLGLPVQVQLVHGVLGVRAGGRSCEKAC